MNENLMNENLMNDNIVRDALELTVLNDIHDDDEEVTLHTSASEEFGSVEELGIEELQQDRALASEEGKALGQKDIGLYSSFVYVINQIFGPGSLALPIVFQQAGLLLTLPTMAAFMVLSGFASTMTCDAMARIPGNGRFSRRMEFASIVEHY